MKSLFKISYSLKQCFRSRFIHQGVLWLRRRMTASLSAFTVERKVRINTEQQAVEDWNAAPREKET